MATKPKDTTPAGPVRQRYKMATGKGITPPPPKTPKTPC